MNHTNIPAVGCCIRGRHLDNQQQHHRLERDILGRDMVVAAPIDHNGIVGRVGIHLGWGDRRLLRMEQRIHLVAVLVVHRVNHRMWVVADREDIVRIVVVVVEEE